MIDVNREIRITHPEVYACESCTGHTDLGARQGHYNFCEQDKEVDHTILQYLRKNEGITLVDVEMKNGQYLGRYMIKYRGTEDEVLVKLPPQPVPVAV